MSLKMLAAPTTVGTVFHLLKKRQQKTQRIEEVCNEIIKNQYRLIKKSKGNNIPEIEDIQIQLLAKINQNKLSNEYQSKTGIILVGIYDQVSSAKNFPKQNKVLQQLKELIKKWFGGNDPNPPNNGFFNKLRNIIRLKSGKGTIPQLGSGDRVNKLKNIGNQIIRVNVFKNNLIEKIKLRILFNLNYYFVLRLILFIILTELSLFFTFKSIIPNVSTLVFILINYLILIYLHNRRVTEFLSEYVIKRLKSKEKIRKDLFVETFKENYEINSGNIFLENNDILFFSDRREYLKYRNVILIKERNLIKLGISIIMNYKIIVSLEKGEYVIVKNRILDWLIYYLNNKVTIQKIR